MSKINIVLADTDKDYRDALAQYIIENENGRIQLVSFSNKELLENYISNNEGKIDLILAEEFFLSQQVKEKILNYIILSEVKADGDMQKYIFKYQSGEKIVSGIFDNYYSKSENKKKNSSKKTSLYSVYSLCGSRSKTDLVLKMCNLYTGEDKKVFHLSFDALACENEYTAVYEKGLSNVLFELKNKSKIERVREYITKNIETNIDSFAPFQNFLEYYELTCEEAEKIIKVLCDMEEYDYVVIELGLDFGILTRTIMMQSDKTFVTYDILSKSKVEKFKKDIEAGVENKELISKIEFISENDNICEIIKKEEMNNDRDN